MRRPDDNRDNLAGFYAEPSNTLDVVCIGGSSTYVFWEPLRAWNQQGLVSYNFAHDSITPQEIKFDIIEVKKTQSPLLWLIDLTGFENADIQFKDDPNNRIRMYAEAPIRWGVDNMRYSLNRINIINASVLNPEERWSYYFDIIKYHSEWSIRLWQALSAFRDGLSTFADWMDYADYCRMNPLKGFAFIEQSAPVEFTDVSAITEIGELPEKVDTVLKDLLNYCQTEHLQALFIVSPYCQTDEGKRRYNYISQVVRQYGFEFLNSYDYWSDIGFDYAKDLYNERHVNVFGAEKYTDFLTDYLTEHYHLPDRRDDSRYQRWQHLYEDFEKKTKTVKANILNLLN